MTADTLQFVTTALAAVGAVLGVLNYWRAWSRDRVRLVVLVSRGLSGAGVDLLLVEVRNLSTFPVTVTHIGFDLLGNSGMHAQIPRPLFVGSQQALPIRLEPRAAATCLVEIGADPQMHQQIRKYRRAYVSTACGLKVNSSARAFDRLRVALAAQ